jgi:hypothetical protein
MTLRDDNLDRRLQDWLRDVPPHSGRARIAVLRSLTPRRRGGSRWWGLPRIATPPQDAETRSMPERRWLPLAGSFVVAVTVLAVGAGTWIQPYRGDPTRPRTLGSPGG